METNLKAKIALAIFAKTPDLSPVKTRLEATIGQEAATTFYHLSIEATKEVITDAQVQSNNTLLPFFAIAEEEALTHPLWQDCHRIWTGPGDLGQRLHHIYHTLNKTHHGVIMIGTDSPQLPPTILLHAKNMLERTPNHCVIGPCTDGGFYLFGATVNIPENVWKTVTYSTTTTRHELIAALAKHHISTTLLPTLSDVDTQEDLIYLVKHMGEQTYLLPKQKALYQWATSLSM